MIFLRIALAFLILLLLPDIYIYKVYIRKLRNKVSKYLHWMPSIIILLLLLGFFFQHERWQQAFGIYLIVTLCIAIPKVIFTLSHLILSGIRKRFHLPRFDLFTAGIIAIISCIYILFGAIKGKEYFQIKRIDFYSSALPQAFDGYRILQISDIHAGSWTGNKEALAKAISLCNAEQTDLAVFTGDIVNSRSKELTEFMPILSQLHAKDGVYSVLGNHDYGTYVSWENEAARLANIDFLLRKENEMGWKMLINEHAILRKGNDSIALIGVENSGNPPFPNKANLPKAMQGTAGMFKVLLSHDPTHWRREVLPHSDIQLMLSGHTHDMQISLFGISPARMIYPEHKGLYLENERGLYINIGLGYVLFPMRIGAWPEITVITLRKK